MANLGEKQCLLATAESNAKHKFTMQVADVNRALLSVSKAVHGGDRVVFYERWSYIEDKRTGGRGFCLARYKELTSLKSVRP